VALFIAALAITACGGPGGIHAAVAQLPAARLEQQLTRSMPCDDPTDNGPKGRVTASTTYHIHDLPPDQYPHFFDLLRDWWQRNNFRILDDSSHGATDTYLWVDNNRDGFRMALQSNDNGEYLLLRARPVYGRTATRNHLPDGRSTG
jgi:hypothetical protein